MARLSRPPIEDAYGRIRPSRAPTYRVACPALFLRGEGLPRQKRGCPSLRGAIREEAIEVEVCPVSLAGEAECRAVLVEQIHIEPVTA